MEPRVAADLLGVTLEATRPEIDKAYQRRARETHPDRHVDEPETIAAANAAFAELGVARDTLLKQVQLRERYAAGDRYVPSSPAESLAPPASAGFIALLAGLMSAALALAAWGAPHPFGLAEPVIRSVVTVVGFVGYARTGRTGFLVLGAIGLAATALAAALFTTLGALAGTLLTAPSAIGLITVGVNRARIERAKARPAEL